MDRNRGVLFWGEASAGPGSKYLRAPTRVCDPRALRHSNITALLHLYQFKKRKAPRLFHCDSLSHSRSSMQWFSTRHIFGKHDIIADVRAGRLTSVSHPAKVREHLDAWAYLWNLWKSSSFLNFYILWFFFHFILH